MVYTTLLHVQPRPGAEFELGAVVVFCSTYSFYEGSSGPAAASSTPMKLEIVRRV